VKVGDLVKWKGALHLVTRERHHLFNLQEFGSDYPPTILDKAIVPKYIKTGQLIIISK